MIQELLGGVVEERKFSIPGVLLGHDHHLTSSFPAASSSSSSSLSSPSQQSNSAASSPSSVSSENLRCPRCDSSNTKFCYYNNYNLTQPRHFCKTCRRYWTKGGALRNVPIGGGCRKAKPGPPIASSAAAKSAGCGGGKAKPMAAADAMGLRPGVEHELLPSAPILWAAAAPHSSHLLALLRASQAQNCNPNPNPNANPANILNSIRIKEDGGNPSHHVVQSLSLDPLGQLSVGPCGSLWRNEAQYQYHHQQQQQPAAPLQQHSVLGGEVSSLGIQELYQRLRSSTANYGGDHLPVVTSNVGSAPACSLSPAATAAMVSSGSIMEPAPLAGGEFGYWNPALAWNDLPTTNGAFP